MSKLRSFVQTTSDVLKHGVKTGEVLATDEAAKRRLDTCSKCPEYNGFICRKCNCVMSVKTKLLVATCPLHKWN